MPKTSRQYRSAPASLRGRVWTHSQRVALGSGPMGAAPGWELGSFFTRLTMAQLPAFVQHGKRSRYLCSLSAPTRTPARSPRLLLLGILLEKQPQFLARGRAQDPGARHDRCREGVAAGAICRGIECRHGAADNL